MTGLEHHNPQDVVVKPHTSYDKVWFEDNPSPEKKLCDLPKNTQLIEFETREAVDDLSEIKTAINPITDKVDLLTAPSRIYKDLLQERNQKHLNTAGYRYLSEYTNFYLDNERPGEYYSCEYWDIMDVWKGTAIKHQGLDVAESMFSADKKVRQKYYDFKHCSAPYDTGRVHSSLLDGDLRIERFSCGNPACPECSKKQPNKKAQRHIDTYQQVVVKHDGYRGMLQMVQTLPPDLSDELLRDKGLRRKFRKILQGHIWWIFGKKRNAKGQTNIPIEISFHPVGGSDLFASHAHFHCDIVIPSEVIDGEFRYLDPVVTAPGHTSDNWKLDLRKMRVRFNKKLSKLFEREIDVNHPMVTFTPYSYDDSERFWGKVAHSLRYNFRYFIDDYIKSIVRVNVLKETYIVKGKKIIDGRVYIYLYEIKASDYYELYLEGRTIIAQENRCMGWMQKCQVYKDILGLDKFANEQEEINENEWVTVPSKVAVIREHWYNPELKKFEFVKDELHSFIDPFTGNYRHVLRFGTAETFFRRHKLKYEKLKKRAFKKIEKKAKERERKKEGSDAGT